jgi:hypothetical protein
VMNVISIPYIFNIEKRWYVWMMLQRADILWLVKERSRIDYIIGGGVDALLERMNGK